MPSSSRWSTPSRACRIELRASRGLAASLVAVGIAGVPGWMLSDAGALLAACGAGAGLAWALRLASIETRRPALDIVLAGDGRVSIGGVVVDDFGFDARGPLVSLRWRSGGRMHRRLAFPDALEAGARRELRLWALARRDPADPAAVAP